MCGKLHKISEVVPQSGFLVEVVGEECVIHVDVFSAMSGISRFVHPVNTNCTVDKAENVDWTDHVALVRWQST